MSFAAKICRALSLAIILLILVIYLPLSVPRILGYDIYSVISGSMEPTIPVGSVAYTEAVDPAVLIPGDIVTFQPADAETAITHRVVQNNGNDRTLITKGDANADNDFRPVWYSDVKGLVVFHAPYYGYFADLASEPAGKIAAGVFAVAAILLGILAGQINDLQEKEAASTPPVPKYDDDRTSFAKKKPVRKKSGSGVLVALMMAVFLGFGSFAAYKTAESFVGRSKTAEEYDSMAQYVSSDGASSQQIAEQKDSVSERPKTPIPAIDFEVPAIDFTAIAKDGYTNCVAWIYIPDTAVNYPVFYSGENDYYLHHTGKGEESVAGAIYLDGRNARDFGDTHNILYGHHMADGSMFAGLKSFKDAEYYPEHRYGVLITPEGYRVIEFFSGYVASVDQDAWTIEYGGEENYVNWINAECALSCFRADTVPLSGDRVITLSTCSYEFDNARFVLHGILY